MIHYEIKVWRSGDFPLGPWVASVTYSSKRHYAFTRRGALRKANRWVDAERRRYNAERVRA